jgi:hypothetical protein
MSRRHPRRVVSPQMTGHGRSRCGDRAQPVRWQLRCGRHRHTPPAPRRYPVPAATAQRGAPRQVSMVRTGDTELACHRYSAANLDPRRRQTLSSRGSTSIMTRSLVGHMRISHSTITPAGRPRPRRKTKLGLSTRFPLLVVFLPLGSWWIRDRSGRQAQGVEGSGRYTRPRRQVRSA